MLDFLDIEKPLFKDKPNFGLLESKGFSYNRQHFELPKLPQLKFYYNKQANLLRIKGSLPYLVNGQNFSFTHQDALLGIEALQDALELNLTGAWVNSFEYGKIVECEQPMKLILGNHYKLKGAQKIEFESGKYFKNSYLNLKLYDAKKRIVQQLQKEQRDHLKTLGLYNPSKSYLKIESHYKKPAACFRGRDVVYLTDLVKPSFVSECQKNLLNQYNQIEKGMKLKLPENKKELNTTAIIYSALRMAALEHGFNPEEKLKQVFDAIPDSVLNSHDRKQRKRQLRQNKKKIACSTVSPFDYSQALEQSFDRA